MIFANPWQFLWLLALLPLVVLYVWKRNRQHAEMLISNARVLASMKPTWRVRLRHLPFVLAVLAAVFVICALARPQKTDSWRNETTEGIDIVMALDISSSMLAEDLKPNRLEAAKSVATEFVSNRPNDNVGLVVFSAESFTQCPLTINHAELINLMKGVKSGMIADGTAIGSGLATAVNRIKDSKAVSKVVILLTDGSNNQGAIAPITAGEIAQTFGIRVYTIGVGSRGQAPYPFQTPYGVQYQNIDVDIDEDVLQQIATTTGGAYFRATDTESLKSIYAEIDQMEKTRINVKEFSQKEEMFSYFVLAALCCMVLQVALRCTVLKSIP